MVHQRVGGAEHIDRSSLRLATLTLLQRHLKYTTDLEPIRDAVAGVARVVVSIRMVWRRVDHPKIRHNIHV